VYDGRDHRGGELARTRKRAGRAAEEIQVEASPPPSAEGPPLSGTLLRVAPLIFTSGLCALIYQTAWQREFRLVFGASTAASAAVVAVFMGGLGLGGRLIGPRADRSSNPLRLYAGLEAVVALTALMTPAWLRLARTAYLSLGGTVVMGDAGGNAVRLVLAALVLLPPTFVAGGTLGAAARAVEDEDDPRRRGMAVLYGLNTLGAVVGCFVATFWLLERLGTRRTLWMAALLNLLVAVIAAAWSRRQTAAPQDDGAGQAAAETTRDASSLSGRFVLPAAGIVGFAFFLMELVWYRMLGPILGGTVYTFGLVLAVALTGVAVGGLLYGLAFKRWVPTLTAFAVTCLLESAMVCLPWALGDRLALLADGLRPPPGAGLWSYLGGWTLVAAIVVLPSSIVAGAQFPLLVALLGRGRARVAQHIGKAYLWNTVGGIAGALAGGFGLLPLLTAPGCWKAVSLLLAALALVALVIERRGARVLVPVLAGIVAVVVTLALAQGPTAVWRHSSIGVGRAKAPRAGGPNALKAWVNDMRRAVVWEREGVESSVAVQTIAALSFVVNGKVDGNARNDAPTQVMSGLLGALLRPGARRSLVIGLGTGSTAGWLAAVPGMERADVVELEPAILDVARMCAAVNHDAMNNPRVRVAIGDAREALMAGRERYDLVFSEPSNPYRAGIASLFTREFYESVASDLEPEGVFLQWVQAYDVDEQTVATVIATLGRVFPEVEIWQIHQTDLLLVASRRPIHLDVAGLRRRIQEEPFASALRGVWRAVEVEDVLARFVAGPALAREIRSRGQEINTDDRNVVEFSFARTLSKSQPFDVETLRRAAMDLKADRPALSASVDWDRVERQRLAIYAVAGTPPPPAGGEAERARAQAMTQYLSGDLRAAVETFTRHGMSPEGPVETALFAEGLADMGDARAVAHIKTLHDVQPTEADAATARLAFRLGRFDLARDAVASAFVRYRTDPWPSQVSMSHALSLADELTLGRPELVPVLLDALSEPFAVMAIEEPRRLVRLSVASHGRVLDHCQEAVAPFEPWVPWRADVLRYRADCYLSTSDPRALEARADLELYKRQEGAASPPNAATAR
jgi:spermidine synthase